MRRPSVNAPRGPNQPFDNTTAFYWGWFPRGRSGPWRVSLLRRALSWPWVEGSATALRSPSLSRTAANFSKLIWTRKLIHTYTTKSVSVCATWGFRKGYLGQLTLHILIIKLIMIMVTISSRFDDDNATSQFPRPAFSHPRWDRWCISENSRVSPRISKHVGHVA